VENHGNPSVKEFKTGLTVDLSPQRKKFEKLYKQVSQNEKADSVEKLKILKILTPLFKGHSSIAEIPKHFLTIPGFKEYQSCHMFLQERGTTTVEHYFSREGKAFKSLEMDAQSFNKIFNLIRKSKHKIFHHNLIPDLDMKLVGTFLANSTSLKTHNFILIVSRNDFLQPSMNEIKNFDEFFWALPNFIEKALRLSGVEERRILYLNALKLIPQPFEIKNQNGQIIFKNFSEEPNLNLKSTTKLSDGFNANFYQFSNDQTSSELFHHQRVSLLGELLNTLRHELNNPLFGMKLTSDLLVHETDDDEQKSILKEISHNITRSQNIMENFSNLYTNTNSYQLCSLKKLIDESLILAKSEIRQVKVSQYFKDDLYPEFKIFTNPTSMVQIFFNLIVNSSQAMRQAAIKSASIIFNFKHENENLIIEIMDNGPGIKPEIQKTLFEPFFTTKPNGTGLGLSITMTLVKHLHGEISYHSNETGGALFRIVFPLKKIPPPGPGL
jgi:two-component system NtrC family sensor kinase